MGFQFARRLVTSGLVLGLCVAVAAPVAAQRGPVEHIRGTVTAAEAAVLTVKSREGAIVRITLPQKLRVSGLVRASLASVKSGSYIGTAAAPGPGGKLIAQELLIFPEKMRGVGEGHRRWDLTADSTMTNANVEAIVDRANGRELVLNYKGGRKTVVVPKSVPVVTIVRADRAMLVPGANVFVVARKGADGALRALRVAIGKDGLVPPM